MGSDCLHRGTIRSHWWVAAVEFFGMFRFSARAYAHTERTRTTYLLSSILLAFSDFQYQAVMPKSSSGSNSCAAEMFSFFIWASYSACSFLASRTGNSSMWLGGNTKVWTKLSRSEFNLRP